MKQEIKQKAQAVKAHVLENKTAYITGAACLVVGVITGAALTSGEDQKVTAKINNLFCWKPTSTLEQNVVLARRGHPGFIIKCNETGEVYASQRRAAEALGVNRPDLISHLKGEAANVGGYTFTNLGEAQ